MKRKIFLAFMVCFFLCRIFAQQKEVKISYEEPSLQESDKVGFNEVWAWVVTGNEKSFTTEKSVTDLCYFSADVNSYGEIVSFPEASVFKNFSGRKHLVVTCSGYALTHSVLNPKDSVRSKIISSIVKNSKNYDGVQIDFETVLSKDGENFLKFLTILKRKLPKNKMFTICVPARNKFVKNDIFDYNLIEPLADRIIIMAYDQHWSTSEAGPVAGMDWCKEILEYAQTVIPSQKLVMGLPFYGRSWQNTSYSKAWLNSGVNRIIAENQVTEIKRENNVPFAEFETSVKVTLWWDDTFSLVKRLQMYKENYVDKVAFWRIGQEESSFWNWIYILPEEIELEIDEIKSSPDEFLKIETSKSVELERDDLVPADDFLIQNENLLP